MRQNKIFSEIAEPDEFFREISRKLKRRLPATLSRFTDVTEPGRNFMRIRYPKEFTRGLYEIQFATPSSKEHSKHFGGGDKAVLAFYYDNENLRESWMEVVLPHREQIEANFGSPVKIGLWGKSCVMIGYKMNTDECGIDPEKYANVFAQFIQATFEPIKQVYRTLGIG